MGPPICGSFHGVGNSGGFGLGLVQTVALNNVFNGRIFPRGVVFTLQVMSENPREALPHECAQTAFQFLDHAKSSFLSLSVDEPDEQDAFPNGQPAELAFETCFEGFFFGSDQGFPVLFGRNECEFILERIHGQPGKFSIRPNFKDTFFEAVETLRPRLAFVVLGE